MRAQIADVVRVAKRHRRLFHNLRNLGALNACTMLKLLFNNILKLSNNRY